MAQLRVYLRIEDLRRQFAAYMATPVRARGYVPIEGMHSLIVEIAPALAIHRVIDLALTAVPEVDPGILFVERQFGILELHAHDLDAVERAGEAILKGIGAKAGDQLKPEILFTDIIESVSDQHAVILNRNRDASMILPGETLLLVEMTPALFAAAANEAEKVAPENTLVDVQMIGASGRLFISGAPEGIRRARAGLNFVHFHVHSMRMIAEGLKDLKILKGGVDGLVTIEDLVEEIVGEIEDEHDRGQKTDVIRRPDGTFDTDARATIDGLEDLVGRVVTDEEREDIDTLGGLIIALAGRVPIRGELISHPSGVEFEVLDADPRRIKRVRVHAPGRVSGDRGPNTD